MADIDIVPKHRSRTWLWIVLAIIIIAIIWFALASGHGASRLGAMLDGGFATQAAVRPLLL